MLRYDIDRSWRLPRDWTPLVEGEVIQTFTGGLPAYLAKTMRRGALFFAAIWTIFCLAPSTAGAQEDLGLRRLGVRGGVTIDPDQVHVGLHVNGGQFAPKIRFQPSLEIGFGSDRVVGTINIDALYTFDPRPWIPYLGGGVGVSLIHRDSGRGDGDFDVGAGLNLIGGFEWGEASKYLLEARVGVGNLPDLKLTVGINF